MSPLKKTFNKAARIVAYSAALTATGLYIEDIVSEPGHSVWDGMTLSVVNTATNNSCSYAGHDKPLHSNRQKSLLDLYNIASQSETGKTIMTNLKNDGAMLCFDDRLDVSDSDGFVNVGEYYSALNLIRLNPNPIWQRGVPGTLVHEGRHHQQDEMNFDEFEKGRNYRPSDQMIMNWVTEADARLAAIIHAHEMQKKGDSSYTQALSSGYRKMAWAFVTELEKSSDIQEAMRASVRAFRDETVFVQSYDKSIVGYLEAIGYGFDPDEDADVLLTDEKLMKLGQMGNYANYMNEELMQFIRESVTMDDYRNMRKQVFEEKRQKKKTAVIAAPSVPTS